MVMDGEELFSVSMLYEISGYEKRVRVSDAKLLSQMTQDDIMGIATEVETNVTEWAVELVGKFPELLELIDAM